MRKVRILQIGDIHFPWAVEQKPSADFGSKPDKIPNVTDNIAPSGIALNKVAASIRSICDPKPDLVVFVGDLTVKGNEDGLRNAVKFCLDGILNPIFSPDEISSRVLFVPGNHDVSRPESASDDPYEKFNLYREVLEEAGISQHSTKVFGRASVPISERTVTALGVNTCLGCGEFRALPQSLSEQLGALLASHDGEVSPDDHLGVISGMQEQLDMPLLDRKDIDGLDIELSGPNGQVAPIVVGHHNLLPQKETRVLAYGELINSGVLREVLSNKDHPIIYLHGHIHAEPVELVRDPTFPDGGVLSISAPLITEGLNVVDVYLDEDLEPVGTDLIPWRFSSTLQLNKLRSLRISLAQGENRLASLHEDARTMFQYLVQAGDSAQRHLSQLASELGHTIEDAARHCDALSWAGLVTISNHHKSYTKWDVRLAI